MAHIEDQAITIEHMNQIGHLDHLFDVAEETVNASKESDLGMIDVAELDLNTGKYHVKNPVTKSLGLIVDPKLFHGFINMRYRVLEDLGASEEGYTDSTVSDFINKCSQVIAGGWSIEGDELKCEWLANKTDGLSKAVILDGDIFLGESGPQVAWYLSKFNVGERQNG